METQDKEFSLTTSCIQVAPSQDTTKFNKLWPSQCTTVMEVGSCRRRCFSAHPANERTSLARQPGLHRKQQVCAIAQICASLQGPNSFLITEPSRGDGATWAQLVHKWNTVAVFLQKGHRHCGRLSTHTGLCLSLKLTWFLCKLLQIALEVKPSGPLWIWTYWEAKTFEACRELAAG